MIFKVAYSKGNRNSIKVVDNEGKEVWMGCSKNVYSWCKKNYNEGDEVDVEYTVKDGQYTATRVTNKRQSNYNPLPKDETRPSKPTPSAPTKKYTGNYMNRKHPEESKQIRALSILSSICEAIQGLAGHIDPNNIGEIIETLFDRFDKKLP